MGVVRIPTPDYFRERGAMRGFTTDGCLSWTVDSEPAQYYARPAFDLPPCPPRSALHQPQRLVSYRMAPGQSCISDRTPCMRNEGRAFDLRLLTECGRLV